MSSKNAVKEIIPGLYQIRLPVPIRSLGYVFSYLVTQEGHNLLIDAGWPSKECSDVLKSSLSSIGITMEAIETMVISHLHPDHFGLAEEIKDSAPSCKLLMHEADASNVLDSYDAYKGFMNDLHGFLAEHGTPQNELQAMLDASSQMLQFFRPPKPASTLKGGEVITVGKDWRFEVIPTPGHTIGTVCLYDRGGSRILFSGDHILPTITPNISLGPFYLGNPLGDYLQSLKRVNELDVALVLPSHEHEFSDLGRRVEEINRHHEERLLDALSVLGSQENKARGMSAYEVASKLHWYSGSWDRLGAWEKRAAVMETLAHLEYLKEEGKVSEIVESTEGKRAVRYVAVQKTTL